MINRICVVLVLILLTAGSSLGASYKLPVTVNAAGYERIDKPVDFGVNFTQALGSIGQSGTIDMGSIYVAETNSVWSVIDTNVPFQFDKDYGFNPTSKASGSIIFMMKGSTPSYGTRYYYIYFKTGTTSTPKYVASQVVLTDNVMDEGQYSYKISNYLGSFYFQKKAGGFSSWTDIGGKDWINWNTAPGAAGKYRGIPNAVNPEGVFHPGFYCCTSTIVSKGPLKIRIRSVNGTKWESIWDFYPRYATMTMTKIAHNYWFLYEGTPGGLLEPSKDYIVRSNGVKTYLSTSWTGDIPTNEWVYFSDSALGRSLYEAHHEDDTLVDTYWTYMGQMTVFGFGRGGSSDMTKYMNRVPQHFTVGLLNSVDFTQNSKQIYSAYKNLRISKLTLKKIS